MECGAHRPRLKAAVPSADQLIALFNDARAIPAGAERDRFLDRACGGNLTLKEQIESLLLAEANEGKFALFTNPAWIPPGAAPAEKPGERIGRYHLLEQLGEGGCGVVYLAEQDEPVRRRVALKVIKLGMDTRSVIARFEAERQALALMDHPHIAKVLDAGATDTGRPYFVMEVVHGIRITDYCDRNSLRCEDRLALFIEVCRAVQHAHQKGIIHRDLKPSNILVTIAGGPGTPGCPKVIDFGVAKATNDQRLTDKTFSTACEQFIGTPAYMSPEQVALRGADIDTRSDVYSLGVLLYELLTGRTPLDGDAIRPSGVSDWPRRIREDEPLRPSVRLAGMAPEELTAVARDRRTDPSRLIRQVRGDLDWIVMKCLEKDRARRYGTADDLGSDLQNYLRNEPVRARPPSRAYQFRKLFRRNRLAFVAAGAVALALVLGLGLSTWQFLEKSQAQQEQLRLTREAQSANQQLKDTISTLELRHAEAFFRDADAGAGIAHLAAMLRRDPSNSVAASRLVSALVHRHWSIRGPAPAPHPGPLVALSFRPDGGHVLSASRDGTARIWEASTGRLVAALPQAGALSSAGYDRSGARIITASADRTARIWDEATGAPLTPPLLHDGEVNWAEFSPDGRLALTAGEDRLVRLWDAASGSLRQTFRGHTSPVLMARFTSDGRRIVTGGQWGSIRVWDVATGEMVFRVEDRQAALETIALSGDGTRLASVCQDERVRLWNLDSREEIPLPIDARAVTHATFSPDSRWLVTSSHDTTARLWDARSGVPVGAPLLHGGTVISARFNLDGGKVVTLSKDHTARVWNTATRKPVGQPIRDPEPFTHAALSPDGDRLVTAGNEGTLQIWDLRPRRHPGLEAHFQAAITTIDFSPSTNALLATAFDGDARVLDAGTLATLAALPHETGLYLARFSPDGSRVFTAGAGGIRFWDWRTSTVVAGPFAHPDRIETVHFSPTGDRLLVAGTNGIARVWSTTNWQAMTPPLVHSRAILMARFSPNGRAVATASEDHTARIWDAETGMPVTPPLIHHDHVRSIDFSPDGAKVVTASTDDTARVWDARTGQSLTPPLQHTRLVDKAIFSPDGARILTGSLDYQARIWDAHTGMAVIAPLSHNYSLIGVAFSADGNVAMTACWNGTLRAWDARSGQPLTESFDAGDWLWKIVAFDPVGCRMATGGRDSTVRVWSIPECPRPVPEWFLTFAEAVAGLRVGARGQLEFVSRVELDRVVEAVTLRDPDSFYPRLIRWFLEDPARRGRWPQ